MSDLVQRLRTRRLDHSIKVNEEAMALMVQAADEIERLRRRIDLIRTIHDKDDMSLLDQVERLREALERIANMACRDERMREIACEALK